MDMCTARRSFPPRHNSHKIFCSRLRVEKILEICTRSHLQNSTLIVSSDISLGSIYFSVFIVLSETECFHCTLYNGTWSDGVHCFFCIEFFQEPSTGFLREEIGVLSYLSCIVYYKLVSTPPKNVASILSHFSHLNSVGQILSIFGSNSKIMFYLLVCNLVISVRSL